MGGDSKGDHGIHDEMSGPAPLMEDISAIYELAFKTAQHEGLEPDDAEECSVAFVEVLLRHPDSVPWQTPAEEQHRWLRCCARNLARDYRRRRQRVQRHESAWPETTDSDGRGGRWDPPEPGPGPETAAVQAELHARLLSALCRLRTDDQTLLRAHYYDSEPLQKIAEDSGKTVDAVKMALCRARRRWRSALERDGLDYIEAVGYLADGNARRIAPPPPAVCLKINPLEALATICVTRCW